MKEKEKFMKAEGEYRQRQYQKGLFCHFYASFPFSSGPPPYNFALCLISLRSFPCLFPVLSFRFC